MVVTKAANRYAKSLLDLSVEQNKLNEVKADMELIREALNSSKELSLLVASKVISEDQKGKGLTAIFGGKISELTTRFINLLTKNQRADLIPGICVDFIRQYKVHNRILSVEIESAVKLPAETINAIRQSIASDQWKEIEITETIDPELIGGFVVKTNNYLFDASVSSRLNDLKRDLVTTTHIAQI